MRYPVTATGKKEDFEKDWRVDQIFGNPTSYGFHEGVDINLKTGGDTDMNQELKAIANGKIVYYHTSHANTPNTFGLHLVYRIDGPWGTRWVHYAHCSPLDFHSGVGDVTEGQIIARLGKTGTTSAHLHWSIFKIDPVSFGIDNIANTQLELNQIWENPIDFVNQWMSVPVPQPTPVTDQSKYDFGPDYGIMELQAARSVLQAQKGEISSLKLQVSSQKAKMNNVAGQLESLANELKS